MKSFFLSGKFVESDIIFFVGTIVYESAKC